MSRSAEVHIISLNLAIAFVLGATPAASETLPELLGRITGAEIEVTGHIGTGLSLGDNEAISFRDTSGVVYSVVFDAGREVRKKLEGCKFAIFGGGNPCAITGKAEIELDGASLRLILFEVSTIEPPAPLE